MSRKNSRFRICKVKNVFDSADVKLLNLYSKSLDAARFRNVVLDSSADIRKNSDDNTSLIQKQIDSLRSYVEKCFLLLFAVLFLDGLIQILS